MATTETLSVRIDPEVFSKLKSYANKHRDVTQAQIVENLLKYFFKQDPEQQRLLVKGVGTDYLALLGDSLQCATWGQHAYDRKFLPWAIDSWGELDEIASAAQHSMGGEELTGEPEKLKGVFSLRRMAWFKLANAWLDLGMALRSRALVDFGVFAGGETTDKHIRAKWDELYSAAIDSIHVAIAYYWLINDSLKRSDEPDPTALYNQACAWTLIARYSVESTCKAEQLSKLVEQLRKKEEEEERLRAGNDQCDINEVQVTQAATDALNQASIRLRGIQKYYHGKAKGMPMNDMQWLFAHAEHDADLSFLRTVKKNEFDQWLKERKSQTSLLDSYERLRVKLPLDVRNALSKTHSEG